MFSLKFITQIIIAVILSSAAFHAHAEALNNENFVIIKDKKIILEIADTEPKRAQGLMYRDELEKNNGMIFIFERPQRVNFWMKNVKIPLDIIFIRNDRAVNIYRNVSPCRSDYCEIYPSETITDYAIELNSGFCDTNNIKIGEKIKLNFNIQEYFKKIKKEVKINEIKFKAS